MEKSKTADYGTVKVLASIIEKLKEVKEETGVPYSKQIELSHVAYYGSKPSGKSKSK